MKTWNRKRIVLLAIAMVAGTFLLPRMAETQEKTKGDTAAGTVPAGPTVKGPASPKTTLKAKITPEQISVNKKPPKKYVAFDYPDLVKDPKKDKIPTPETVIALYNGTEATAKLHLTAINKLEHWLCDHGYSLRDKQDPKKSPIKLQSLVIAKDKSPGPKVAGADQGKQDPKIMALLGSPQQLAKTHAEAVRVPSSAKNFGQIRLLKPLVDVKSFHDNFGDPSLFGANVKAQLTAKGDQNGTGISSEGRAKVSLFGHSTDLAVTTAELTAPRKGGLTAKIKVTTLGIDQIALDHSETKPWSKQDTFQRSIPNSFHVDVHFAIGPVPLSAGIGIKGTVKVPYFVGMLPGSSSASILPHVDCTVFGEVAVDLEFHGLGAKAGLEASLTLLDDSMIVAAKVDQGEDAKGVFITEMFTVSNDATALKGHLGAFIEVSVSIFGVGFSERFEHDFITFGGVHRVSTPFAGSKTTYLQPLPLQDKVNK